MNAKATDRLIEPLEQRTFFDLVPSISSVLPAELVTSVKNNSTVTVDLTSNASAKVTGSYTLTVFASTSPVLGAATDTQLFSASHSAAFSPGRASATKIKLTDFPAVPNGNYYLLAEVTGSLAGTSDNLAVSSTTTAVAAPVIDLTDAISITSPPSDNVFPGKSAGLSLEVFNNGNVPATGSLLTDLGLTADSGVTVTPIGTKTAHINIAPGGHTFIHISEKIPTGFTPGTYVWVAGIDPNNTFGESSTTNNTADSAALTVLPPYPDMLGIFDGTDTIFKGPGKGATVTLDLDFTSESQTNGALVAAGTLVVAGTTSQFNFTGTISTKGAFSGKGTSSSSVYTATYKGKLADNLLSGTVDNTDGNDGHFKLELSA
jgi:hypothetical protein